VGGGASSPHPSASTFPTDTPVAAVLPLEGAGLADPNDRVGV